MIKNAFSQWTLYSLVVAAGCATPPPAAAPAAPAPSAPQAAGAAGSEDEQVALAKKLNNPVASLISVPFQFNYDANTGPKQDGNKYYMNLQPVIPIELDQDWNLISRTIVPVVQQHDLAPGTGTQSGLGDILQSFFLSPKAPTADGWIWGVGPALLFPTANSDLTGSGQYAAGPTAVVLKQEGPWTYGALGNHLWSYAGSDDRRPVNATYLQPFLAYTTPEAVTYTLNSETTYDWTRDDWSVPFNAMVSKLVRFGSQMVSIGGGVRYWARSGPNGPEGVGFRITITPLFPKK